MPFIKHGDAKIVGVLDEEELTEEQKKSVKNATTQTQQKSEKADASVSLKQSGR